MVRFAARSTSVGWSSPHARGDGPLPSGFNPPVFRFSPRPWGWSANLPTLQKAAQVLPTPVGMVRNTTGTPGLSVGSPHARGDGPMSSSRMNSMSGFSPRPWGWSARIGSGTHRARVLPTPVGMVRPPSLLTINLCGSPHARGDGPLIAWGGPYIIEFSPRPWGWSEFGATRTGVSVVLPTPVGMVQSVRPARTGRQGSPHARGDGPKAATVRGGHIEFSPRPWGWSGIAGGHHGGHRVLPTPVGMVRDSAVSEASGLSSPHARGDGPDAQLCTYVAETFSPRPWGWSAMPVANPEVAEVLPTPVGMVRNGKSRPRLPRRSPHARGDGPRW